MAGPSDHIYMIQQHGQVCYMVHWVNFLTAGKDVAWGDILKLVVLPHVLKLSDGDSLVPSSPQWPHLGTRQNH